MNATPAWADHLVVFDTETTGPDPTTDHIVSATIAHLRGGDDVLEPVSWLVNPGVPISDGAASVHGISNERAQAEGVNPKIAAEQMVSILRAASEAGVPVVAYNAVFDFTILRHVCEVHGVEFELPRFILDPFVIDKAVNKYRKGLRTLSRVAEIYGVPLDDAHDSAADAVAAGRVMHRLSPAVAGHTPESLMWLQTQLHDSQATSFEQFRRRQEPDFVADRGWPLRAPLPSNRT